MVRFHFFLQSSILIIARPDLNRYYSKTSFILQQASPDVKMLANNQLKGYKCSQL